MNSIGYMYGFFPDTLWDHPDNAALKELRCDPDVLFPGDVVNIPDKRAKFEAGVTERRHTFRRKGVPSKLRIEFHRLNGEPRSNEPYLLVIKTKSGPLPPIEGKTDEDGLLDESIPPDAVSGEVTLGENDQSSEVYKVRIGSLDPITEVSGVQGRLRNLGFSCEDEDGVFGEETRYALRSFQYQHGLKPIKDDVKEIDQKTLDKLDEVYSS